MKLKIGIILLILCCIFFLLIIVVPFLDLTTTHKTVAITALIVLGEVSFYLGLFLVGKTIWQKYKQRITDWLIVFFKRKDKTNTNTNEQTF